MFDVGANVGSNTSAFLALGARVVAVEPQPACAQELRRRFRGRDVVVTELAAGGAAGTAVMRVPEVSTIASLSDEWVAAVRDSGRFSEYNWDEQITAGVTTPDELVAKHGEPAFVKIDVERYEADVLAGLSRPVRALSLEYVPEFSAAALTCIDRLVGLGFVEFNFTGEHSLGFVWEAWLPGGEVKEGLAAESEWGDVYACRDRHQPSSVGISRAHLKGQ